MIFSTDAKQLYIPIPFKIPITALSYPYKLTENRRAYSSIV